MSRLRFRLLPDSLLAGLLLASWLRFGYSQGSAPPGPPQLGGAHFKITVIKQDGFLESSIDGDGKVTYSGYCIDILNAISRPDRGNFSFELLRPSGFGSLCNPRADINTDEPYDEQYHGQFNCGQADVSDVPLTNFTTDLYVALFYITTARQAVNQFTIPISPPETGRLTMYGTAVRIDDIPDLIEQQKAGKQKPVCVNAASATGPYLQQAFPDLQTRAVVGPDENHHKAFLSGECDIFIRDNPVATRFVLKRFLNNECLIRGRPIGIIGKPLSFGPGRYGFGIRSDIPPHVVRAIDYWLNALTTCAPADPDSLCPGGEGSLQSMYVEAGGDGSECGYVAYPPEPGGKSLSTGAIVGIVLGAVGLVAIVYTIVAVYKLRAQRRRIRKRFVQQIARNIAIGPSPSSIPADKLAEEVQHIGKNADGTVQKEDLLAWMSDVKMTFISDKDFEALWAAMDVDGTGTVDPVEFFVFLSSCGPEFEEVFNEQQNMSKVEKLKLAARRLSNINALGEQGVRQLEHNLERGR